MHYVFIFLYSYSNPEDFSIVYLHITTEFTSVITNNFTQYCYARRMLNEVLKLTKEIFFFRVADKANNRLLSSLW